MPRGCGRHNLRQEQENDFAVRNLSDVAETAAETSKVMTLLLSGIAAISSLVGGITCEIGIRKAVGARSKQVYRGGRHFGLRPGSGIRLTSSSVADNDVGIGAQSCGVGSDQSLALRIKRAV